MKLRSSLQQSSQITNKREMPRFLQVIATPNDDAQAYRLKAMQADDVAVLQWANVKDYVGPAAAAATSNTISMIG
jgi:hypothetical protein